MFVLRIYVVNGDMELANTAHRLFGRSLVDITNVEMEVKNARKKVGCCITSIMFFAQLRRCVCLLATRSLKLHPTVEQIATSRHHHRRENKLSHCPLFTIIFCRAHSY